MAGIWRKILTCCMEQRSNENLTSALLGDKGVPVVCVSAVHNAMYCHGVPYQTNIWRLISVRHQNSVWSCREKSHCSVDETTNIKRSQWETFMSGVEKKNAIWILLNVLTSLCMGALYCLYRFSSTLTVLLEYWQFITTIKPVILSFSVYRKRSNQQYQLCISNLPNPPSLSAWNW